MKNFHPQRLEKSQKYLTHQIASRLGGIAKIGIGKLKTMKMGGRLFLLPWLKYLIAE